MNWRDAIWFLSIFLKTRIFPSICGACPCALRHTPLTPITSIRDEQWHNRIIAHHHRWPPSLSQINSNRVVHFFFACFCCRPPPLYTASSMGWLKNVQWCNWKIIKRTWAKEANDFFFAAVVAVIVVVSKQFYFKVYKHWAYATAANQSASTCLPHLWKYIKHRSCHHGKNRMAAGRGSLHLMSSSRSRLPTMFDDFWLIGWQLSFNLF